MPDDLDYLISPCVGVCSHDPESGLCRGCGRSEREVGSWRFEDDAWRRALLEDLRRRAAELGHPEWQAAYQLKIDRMLGRVR